jgi:hypothetical protein
MRIGNIIELPKSGSSYGIVQDEYGNRWTVDRGEIPEGSDAGDDYAYQVDFNHATSTPTLRHDQDR